MPYLSDPVFAALAATTWVLLYNQRFWTQTLQAMGTGFAPWLFYGALALLLVFLHSAVLLMLPGRVAMRTGASLLFIIAAACAYFTDTFGTAFDREMIHNLFETDRREAADLMTFAFGARLVLLGVVPAVLLWRVPLAPRGWRVALRQRFAFLFAGALLCVASALVVSASYAVFLREYKPLRSLLSPGAAVAGTIAFLQEDTSRSTPSAWPGGAPWRVARASTVAVAAKRPVLVVLVVGETARAANFQLNGYGRATTPLLAARDDLVYFPDTAACGTSTAFSVPCMFSHLPRTEFSHESAARYFNVLDVVQQAGVLVHWFDNNAGCKEVCARVPTLRTAADCGATPCRDEAMEEPFAALLPTLDRDALVVLHQNGSHGPAYFERYPEGQEHFQPACRSNRIDACERAAVVNAYDNTLRYTDAQLARLIGLLEQWSDRLDAAVLYVSDHGESLGEGGVYLHGMPYRFAPAEQKQVPMLMWLSPSYRERAGLDLPCLREQATHGPYSHDNLYHTVMGLTGVRDAAYEAGLDLVQPCAGTGSLMAAARPREVIRPPRQAEAARAAAGAPAAPAARTSLKPAPAG